MTARARISRERKPSVRVAGRKPPAPLPAADPSLEEGFSLAAWLVAQEAWSRETFGPGERTDGILSHIEKELGEIRENPRDLEEWVDVLILALDGFWRHGGSPRRLAELLSGKQSRNFARHWPDWRDYGQDEAIEHDRSRE